MQTIRLEKEEIQLAAQLLMGGSVVAFPTDTVYGLGIIYDDRMALQALKKAKGRPETKPFPLMISRMDQLRDVAHVTMAAKKLADAFMPGALTLVLKKKKQVSDEITNGKDTIAVRMSDDVFVQSLINYCGRPLLVTSANRSGEASALTAAQVLSQLDGAIDAIVMGKAAGTQASTIVDVSTDKIRILRHGEIREEDIRRVLKEEI